MKNAVLSKEKHNFHEKVSNESVFEKLRVPVAISSAKNNEMLSFDAVVKGF